MRHVPLRLAALLSFGLSACGPDAGPAGEDDGWRALQSADSTGAVVAAFLARDAAPTEGEPMPASLYLRCTEGVPSVYVDWRAELVADTATVTYAFDDLPEATEPWVASSDRRAAGLWSDSLSAPFIDRLVRHDRMEVSVETVQGERTRAFRLDGLDEASGAFREACGLEDEETSQRGSAGGYGAVTS